MKRSWKVRGLAVLAGVGLFSALFASQWSQAWSGGPKGLGTMGNLAGLHDPLRLMAMRSPGERGAGALLIKKPIRVTPPAPPAGAPPVRLNMLRAPPPPLPGAPEGPFAAPPIMPPGLLRGPPVASFEGPQISPPFVPLPIGPWPEGPVIVVLGPTPNPPPQPEPPAPEPPSPQPPTPVPPTPEPPTPEPPIPLPPTPFPPNPEPPGPFPPTPLPPTPPPTTPVPEPSAWLLLILGVFGAGAMLRRRRATASGAARPV